MAIRTIRFDPRSEKLLADVVRRTGMNASEALKAGLTVLHQRLRARDDPYAVYAALDLGQGGYTRAQAGEAKQAIRHLVRRKHRR